MDRAIRITCVLIVGLFSGRPAESETTSAICSASASCSTLSCAGGATKVSCANGPCTATGSGGSCTLSGSGACGVCRSVPAAAGNNLTYNPVKPCRLLDTRLAGGPIAAGETRNFHVRGTTLSSQGGNSSGCGIGANTTSAMINFVATDAAGAGHLKSWAYPDVAVPNAAILNYGAVSGLLAIANGIAVPTCNPAISSCTFDIRIQANASQTQVVADVVGYFEGLSTVLTVAICSQPGSCVSMECSSPSTEVTCASGPCTAVSSTGSCSTTSGGCLICRP